jgi:hypothetical protein
MKSHIVCDAICTMLVSCLTYSTLKTEVTCSSETSTYFERTTQRYIPEELFISMPVGRGGIYISE